MQLFYFLLLKCNEKCNYFLSEFSRESKKQAPLGGPVFANVLSDLLLITVIERDRHNCKDDWPDDHPESIHIATF